MKRLLAALTLALLLSLSAAVGVANATHSENGNTDGPPRDFAVGSATIPSIVPSEKADFSFAAHSGPLGENPSGYINNRIEGFISDNAHVDCLRVGGNRAAAAGAVEELPGFPGVVRGVGVVAEDNGEPSEQPPDRAIVFRYTAPAEDINICRTSFILFRVARPLESGNVTVHDGQPKLPGPSAADEQALPKEEALEQLQEQGIEIQFLSSTE